MEFDPARTALRAGRVRKKRRRRRMPCSSPPVGVPSRARVILLVEGDAGLRDQLSQSLRGAGHEVLEARGGLEAFALCQRHAGPIDGLVVEADMPLLNGPALAWRL